MVRKSKTGSACPGPQAPVSETWPGIAPWRHGRFEKLQGVDKLSLNISSVCTVVSCSLKYLSNAKFGNYKSEGGLHINI